MQFPESQPIPAWAQRERSNDLIWIGENMQVFWPAAKKAFQEIGRGAIAVDTTTRPAGSGHPFTYISEEGIVKIGEADALRMVHAYDPTWEFVAILLKAERRVSIYRIGVPNQKQ